MEKSVAGFTLVEVLVTLAIIALLASQAYPAYQQHVIRMRRQEAQATLLRLMQQQERYFTQTNTYLEFSAGASDGPARQFPWWSGSSQRASAYEIEAKPCAGQLISECVRLVATPGTANVDPHFRDADCGQLTLASNGQRSASGPAARCWP